MDKKPNKLSTALKSFWFYSSASILVSLAIAIFFYRLKFSGGLSENSTDWSNFGSYMGGVFGPLVSFVTLLAVLKTVYMQRELLDVQKHEFNQLLKLQRIDSLKQEEQLALAKSEANRAKVLAYQTSILNLIESYSNEFRMDANEMFAAAEKAASGQFSILEGMNAESKYRALCDKSRKTVADLKLLALELSIAEFSDVSEVRDKFAPRLLQILGDDETTD
ncbi:hypothetical protein [Pseudomonas sp.]|uniref:hypothetical protein n=1 Tax=Pseudomonas sp. TaxID=306 RepID=UPI0028AD8151|nr:hypothetical protein [Pseudomonas sp.]